MKRKVRGKRTINYKNVYILFVSVVAVLSLVGNVIQDHYYNKALDIQQETIEMMANEYFEMSTDVQTAMYEK